MEQPNGEIIGHPKPSPLTAERLLQAQKQEETKSGSARQEQAVRTPSAARFNAIRTANAPAHSAVTVRPGQSRCQR